MRDPQSSPSDPTRLSRIHQAVSDCKEFHRLEASTLQALQGICQKGAENHMFPLIFYRKITCFSGGFLDDVRISNTHFPGFSPIFPMKTPILRAPGPRSSAGLLPCRGFLAGRHAGIQDLTLTQQCHDLGYGHLTLS